LFSSNPQELELTDFCRAPTKQLSQQIYDKNVINCDKPNEILVKHFIYAKQVQILGMFFSELDN